MTSPFLTGESSEQSGLRTRSLLNWYYVCHGPLVRFVLVRAAFRAFAF